MIRRIITLSAAFLATILMLGLTAGMASAADDVPGLSIGVIGYNAYGADVAGNRNSEYVNIVNSNTDAVDVKGLLVQDAWARGRDKTTGCNTFTVKDGTLPVEANAAPNMLPAGHTLRIYVGDGSPSVSGTVHKMFMHSWVKCGYNGHIFNNGAGGNRFAPWDVAWITLAGHSESKGYNFSFGYVAH